MIKAFATIGVVLFFIAIFVRLSEGKSAQAIKDFFDAGTNIFKGAFRGN